MRLLLKLPFIVLLFAVSLLMAFIASIPTLRLSESYEITVSVDGQDDVVVFLNSTGIVKVSGDVPSGVRVYLLSTLDYWDYLNSDKLPDDYLGEGGKKELVVENPCCLLIRSYREGSCSLKLSIEVYKEEHAHALLAIPAYLMTVLATGLLLIRTMVKLDQSKSRVRTIKSLEEK